MHKPTREQKEWLYKVVEKFSRVQMAQEKYEQEKEEYRVLFEDLNPFFKTIKHGDHRDLMDRFTFAIQPTKDDKPLKFVKPKKAKNKDGIVDPYENKKALEIRKKSAWRPEAGKHPWKKKMPELDKPKRHGGKLDEAKEEEIIRLLKICESAKEVVIKSGVSLPTVHAVAKRNGIPVPSARRGRKTRGQIVGDTIFIEEDTDRGMQVMTDDEESEAADVFASNKVDEDDEDDGPESDI